MCCWGDCGDCCGDTAIGVLQVWMHQRREHQTQNRLLLLSLLCLLQKRQLDPRLQVGMQQRAQSRLCLLWLRVAVVAVSTAVVTAGSGYCKFGWSSQAAPECLATFLVSPTLLPLLTLIRIYIYMHTFTYAYVYMYISMYAYIHTLCKDRAGHAPAPKKKKKTQKQHWFVLFFN